VLGFSPRLPRWRDVFARIWRWKDSIAAKLVAGISVAGMIYFALYPFGVRPHMPMAQYLYRQPPGLVYSFGEPFRSYPLYRPADSQTERLRDSAQLEQLLDKGPVLLMSEVPVPRGAPPDARVTLIYSEFPLARFGLGEAGADYIRNYQAFAARHGWLKLLPLHWYTLYRVERSAAMRS
jgi:phosphatidylinositol glycan class B